MVSTPSTPNGGTSAPRTALRVGFVEGVMPDKWFARWRERSRRPLVGVPLDPADQEVMVRSGELDLALVRLPVDRTGLHVVTLYDEQPVVVLPRDHFLTLADQVVLGDLADEQFPLGVPAGLSPTASPLPFPPMSTRDAVEVAAAGTGVVLLPQSVARLHRRKDVEIRPVADLPSTTIGLAWLIERDDDETQAFVGVVRGRSPRSSR